MECWGGVVVKTGHPSFFPTTLHLTTPPQYSNVPPVNPKEVVKEIMRRTPAPVNRRATHGQWVEPAWAVRGLVEQKWEVCAAVRQVIATLNLHPPDKAFKGIRACYYTLRHKPWPTK